MKKTKLFIYGLSLLTLTSGVLFGISINNQQNNKEANAYSEASLPSTIVLNDTSASDVRSYYSSLNGLATSQRQGTNLLKNLKIILKNGQKYFNYDSGNTVWKMYEITDRDWSKSPASSITNGTYNSGTNTITGYTYNSTDPYIHAYYVNRNVTNQTTAWSDHQQTQWGINREHLWPKAEGFENSGNGGARGDPMHLVAANGYANNIHSNYYYGYVDTTSSYTNCGSKYSNLSGNLRGTSKTLGTGTVFEPQDCDKGDIARAIFYMAARYNYFSGSDSDGIDSDNPNLVLVNNTSDWANSGYQSNTTTTGKLGVVQDLLEWNRLDPPDEYEIHRNNLLYTNFTNNRNPFVDFPEWAEYIWGKSVNGSYNSSSTGYATPSSDTINSFGGGSSTVSVTGVSVSPTNASLEVDGTQQLTVTVSPNNATDKSVTYSSNNTTVATVSNSGLITAKAAGNATITVTTTDGGHTATCAVTVTQSSTPPSPGSETTIAYGDTFSPALPTASGSVNSTSTEHLDSTSNISFYEQGIYKGSAANYLMFAQNKGFLYNKTSLGTINSVTVSYTNESSGTGKIGVYFGSSLSDVSTYTTTNNDTIDTTNRYDTFTNNTSGKGFFQISTSNKNVQITSIVISYTSSGSTPKPVTLTGISTSGQTTTYNVGDTFSYDGTLTATYSDGSSHAVTPTNVSSPDMSTSGNKTITLTYTEGGVTKTCTYQITVNEVVSSGDTYKLATGNNPLLPGDQVIIVAQSSSSASSCYVIKDTIYNSYYLTSNNGTVSNQELNYDSDTMTVWTVGLTNDGYTFYSNNKYLYGYTNNTYKNLGLSETIKAGTCWTITKNNNSNGYDVISNNLYLEYYSSKFTTYSSSNTSYPINFYKKVLNASNYAQTLLDNITCVSTGNSAPTLGLTWSQLGDLYNSISLTSEKNLLKTATYTVSNSVVTPTNGTNQTIALAMSKYDIIVGKYSYTDFVSRKGTSAYGYAYMPKYSFITNNSGIIPTIIVITSLAAITAIGVYFSIKKRKEN